MRGLLLGSHFSNVSCVHFTSTMSNGGNAAEASVVAAAHKSVLSKGDAAFKPDVAFYSDVDTKCLLCHEPYLLVLDADEKWDHYPVKICEKGEHFVCAKCAKAMIMQALGGEDFDYYNVPQNVVSIGEKCVIVDEMTRRDNDLPCPMRCGGNMRFHRGTKFFGSRHFNMCLSGGLHNPSSAREAAVLGTATDALDTSNTELMTMLAKFEKIATKCKENLGQVGSSAEEKGKDVVKLTKQVTELEARQERLTEENVGLMRELREKARANVLASTWQELEDTKQCVEKTQATLAEQLRKSESDYVRKMKEIEDTYRYQIDRMTYKFDCHMKNLQTEHSKKIHELSVVYKMKMDEISRLNDNMIEEQSRVERQIKKEKEFELKYHKQFLEQKVAEREHAITEHHKWIHEELKVLDVPVVVSRLRTPKDRDEVLALLTDKFRGEVVARQKQIEAEEKAKVEQYIVQFKQSKKAHAEAAHRKAMADIQKEKADASTKIETRVQELGAQMVTFRAWFEAQRQKK